MGGFRNPLSGPVVYIKSTIGMGVSQLRTPFEEDHSVVVPKDLSIQGEFPLSVVNVFPDVVFVFGLIPGQAVAVVQLNHGLGTRAGTHLTVHVKLELDIVLAGPDPNGNAGEEVIGTAALGDFDIGHGTVCPRHHAYVARPNRTRYARLRRGPESRNHP